LTCSHDVCVVVVGVIAWSLNLQLLVQPLPIVVSSNPADGEVYSIQDNVKKLVSDLRQVDVFFGILRFPQLIKLTSTI
jgi:hypothetical protein